MENGSRLVLSRSWTFGALQAGANLRFATDSAIRDFACKGGKWKMTYHHACAVIGCAKDSFMENVGNLFLIFV